MPIVIELTDGQRIDATPNADGEVPWLDMFIVVEGENKKIKAIHAVPEMVTPKGGGGPPFKSWKTTLPGAG